MRRWCFGRTITQYLVASLRGCRRSLIDRNTNKEGQQRTANHHEDNNRSTNITSNSSNNEPVWRSGFSPGDRQRTATAKEEHFLQWGAKEVALLAESDWHIAHQSVGFMQSLKGSPSGTAVINFVEIQFSYCIFNFFHNLRLLGVSWSGLWTQVFENAYEADWE